MLVQFVVVMGLLTIGSTGPAGSFTQTSQSTRVTSLQKSVLDLQKELRELSSNVQQSRTGNVLERVGALETLLDQLKSSLDAEKRQDRGGNAANDATIANLVASYDSMQIQMRDLKNVMEKKAKEESERRLPEECVLDIKNRDFQACEDKLKLMGDGKINYIIREVYNNHAANFDLVLDFGTHVRNIPRCFMVFKALRHEMRVNGHTDCLKNLKFLQKLRSEVVEQTYTAKNEVKPEVEALERELEDTVVADGKEVLKKAMRDDSYKTGSEVKSVSNTIHSYKNLLFTRIISEVVNDMYYHMSRQKILSYVRSHSYLEQIIVGYQAMFNKMKSSNTLNDGAVLNLAHGVKELTEMDNWNNIHEEIKEKLMSVKRGLPKSVRNLVFSSSVCIKSEEYNEYMAVGSNTHDEKRRYVYTSGNYYGRWQFEVMNLDDSKYLIKNTEYGEYLYSTQFNYDEERRWVMTWRPQNAVSNGVFKVEVDGDLIYIYNTDHNEYMYVANDYFKFDGNKRRVFQWLLGTKDSQSRWRVEC